MSWKTSAALAGLFLFGVGAAVVDGYLLVSGSVFMAVRMLMGFIEERDKRYD